MIKTSDLKHLVIEPVLRDAQLYSEAAVNLILGTAAHESRMGKYFMQTNGPAIGIFQMEPATHDDIWGNYLKYKDAKPYTAMLDALCYHKHRSDIMFWNLRYAALMCRVHYYRKPDPLPEADDIRALGEYWKKHYNTHLGKGTVDKFVENYNRFILN
jgi:hypothetical protein